MKPCCCEETVHLATLCTIAEMFVQSFKVTYVNNNQKITQFPISD